MPYRPGTVTATNSHAVMAAEIADLRRVQAAVARELALLAVVREASGHLLAWLREMEACGRFEEDSELQRLMTATEEAIERSRRG